MTLMECIFATTIFSVKLMHHFRVVLPEDGRSGPRSSCSILERISSMREVSVVEVVVVVGLNPGGRNDEMSSWINTPEK